MLCAWVALISILSRSCGIPICCTLSSCGAVIREIPSFGALSFLRPLWVFLAIICSIVFIYFADPAVQSEASVKSRPLDKRLVKASSGYPDFSIYPPVLRKRLPEVQVVKLAWSYPIFDLCKYICLDVKLETEITWL